MKIKVLFLIIALLAATIFFCIISYEMHIRKIDEENCNLQTKLYFSNKYSGINYELELYKGVFDSLICRNLNPITKQNFIKLFSDDTICYLEEIDSTNELVYADFKQIYWNNRKNIYYKKYDNILKLKNMQIYYIFNQDTFVSEISDYHKATDLDIQYYLKNQDISTEDNIMIFNDQK